MTKDLSQTITILGRKFLRDSHSNISQSIIGKTEAKLHLLPNHPINIIKEKIQNSLQKRFKYKVWDSLDPVATIHQNFDSLLIPADHPGRLPTDTYYINKDMLLRCHTSAHQEDVMKTKESDAYLLAADVYRRDEVDQTHYPVFHQMEGIRMFSRDQLDEMKRAFKKEVLEDTKKNPIQKYHSIEDATGSLSLS